MAYWREDPNMQAAMSAASAAQNLAQGGVNAVTSGGTRVTNLTDTAKNLVSQATSITNGATADIDRMRGQATDMEKYAASIFGKGTDIVDSAGKIKENASAIGAFAAPVSDIASALSDRVGLYNNLGNTVIRNAGDLDPFIATLTKNGNQMYSEGTDWVNKANSVFGVGNGLLNMDANSSPLAAEFMKLYGAVDPAVYSARMQADAKAKLDSEEAQMRRNVARAGGSITGGNALALQKQYRQAMATAVAAAANKGRQLGLDKQGEFLKTISDAANSLIGTGNQTFSAGVGAQNAGNSAINDAGELEAKKTQLISTGAQIFGLGDAAMKSAGDLYGDAADIIGKENASLGLSADKIKQSADLDASAASIAKDMASIYGSAASAQLSQAEVLGKNASTLNQTASTWTSYLSALENAYGNAARISANTSDMYSSIVKAGNGAGGGGGGGRMLGGMNVSQAPEDDWMNWRGTGHSQTWNQNDGFRLAGQLGVI